MENGYRRLPKLITHASSHGSSAGQNGNGTACFGGLFNETAFNELPPSWFEIYVNHHERLRKNSSQLPPLRIPDLKLHLIAVDSLAQRLAHFYHDVLTKHAEEFPSTSLLP